LGYLGVDLTLETLRDFKHHKGEIHSLAEMERILGEIAAVARFHAEPPESTEFSQKFLLRGNDEVAVRNFLTPELRHAWLRDQVELRTEASGPWVVFFYPRLPRITAAYRLIAQSCPAMLGHASFNIS
jgi:hypothetical protein